MKEENIGVLSAGERFGFKGFEWIVLDNNVDGGVLAIMASAWNNEEYSFDDDGCNNYAKSSLRRKLLNELLPVLGEDNLIPHEVDMVADNGDDRYGTVTDRVFILSCDEYRKYRKHVPLLPEWMWTCTPFVGKMGDRRFRDRLMKDAADNLKIAAAEFDTHPFLINCKNGTYDLESLTFREHKWNDFLTMQTNFEYGVKKEKCARWEQFIKEVTQNDKDKADYLQRALGYSILGTSKEECMFILHGKTTRNGKSTMLDAIQHLLGDYSTVTPVELICRGDRAKNAEAASPVLAKLKGKRMVTMSESDTAGKLDESVIKQLTGGEEITARELYQTAITFKPQFTMWLSCNDLPAVKDKSLFASDRVRVIEFNRHFNDDEQDKGLKDYFESPEAMRGIFTWLVAGYFKYRRFGLKMSANMQKVVKQYEKDNDLVLQYLEEKCQKQDNVKTRAKTLYDNYKLWCKSNGYYVCSMKKFNAELMAHPEWYEQKSVSGGVAVYYGIMMKTTG